jgi:hypothetical protein
MLTGAFIDAHQKHIPRSLYPGAATAGKYQAFAPLEEST